MWIALAAASVLWPARLAGALDGAPLDTRIDALLIGLALPALVAINPRAIKTSAARGLIVALLLWKGVLAVSAVPDGWCVRFESPVPIFIDNLRVPHAWDVRADWRSETPRCSAIMTRAYNSTFEFPAWFFNLPPSNLKEPATEAERPPYAQFNTDISGFLRPRTDGQLSVDLSDDVRVNATIDGVLIERAALLKGVPLVAGLHEIRLSGTITGERWRLVPMWSGRVVFNSVEATTVRPGLIDAWLRPWGSWITTLLVLALALVITTSLIRRVEFTAATVAAVAEIIAAVATVGRPVAMRAMPIVLAIMAAMKLPRRLQNIFGAQLLIGLPFLALIAVRALDQIGHTTWYTVGDDWWLFQRFAYRIYLQGYWLEAGEKAFWFQPFYRWIAGALHMVFGDSSVGEFLWDGACAWTGALFAFYVTKVVAGFRWGVIAAVTTLALFTLGPGWYLFGRGLSEISSAGLVYAAALLLLRGRHSHKLSLLLAGVCIAIAFYTRLNNLLFAASVAAFSLPMRMAAGQWLRWREWLPHVSRRAFTTVAAAVIIAIVLFGLRTYYYTGRLNPLAGTQASARSIWQTSDEGLTPRQNLTRSVLLVMTMSDPPKLEPRALPIVTGLVAAILALAGVRRFRDLPLNVVAFCIAGMAGAFVAAGSSYPGRFSIHLIPVTVAITISTIAMFVSPREDRA